MGDIDGNLIGYKGFRNFSRSPFLSYIVERRRQDRGGGHGGQLLPSPSESAGPRLTDIM